VTVIPAPEPGAKAEGLSEFPEAMLEDAIAFLRRVRPEGPWTLTAIFPERDSGPTQTETFGPNAADSALTWLEARSGRMNLYWMVNPARSVLTSKAKKKDVEELVMLHVDIDPKKDEDPEAARADAIARLEEGKHAPPPSIVIDSGGGVQAFWLLDEPLYIGGNIPAAEEAEAYNRHLEECFEADSCHNCDRVMRLPGTINLPNQRKRDGGRVPRVAQLLEYHDDRVYPLAAFRAAPRSPSMGVVSLERGELRRIASERDLEEWQVPGWATATIAQGEHPTEPGKWGGDRSRAVFAVTCELVRRGVPPELIVGILTDEGLGISGHIRAQKRHVEYAWEQVEKATAKVAQQADDFARDKDGKPYANHQGNIRLAVRKLGVELRHDTFADRSEIAGLEGHGPHLDDAARDRLWLEIDERFGFRPHLEFFTRVLMDAARGAPFHPVIEYLGALEWDGTPRLDRWLSTYGGAEDSEYTRAVGALVMVAAVRRVKQPGGKFDEMLTLESKQGTNKSSALRVLAVRDEWFADDLPLNADGKKVIEQTAGKWIIEAGELKGMRKGEVEHLKAFLSRQDDTARLSYARLPVIVPRQFVVIGTTNSDRYLRDLTGNRRFWPVRVEGFDLEALRRDRDQIWAEAAAREAAGDSIRLDPSLYAAAGAEQEARRVDDPFVETLSAVLGDSAGKLRAADVWKLLGIPAGQQTQDQNARVGDAMRELGWERTKRRFGGTPEHAYVRGSPAARERSIEVSFGVAGWYVEDALQGNLANGGDDGELPY
jgi:predicted P-loop ATPase